MGTRNELIFRLELTQWFKLFYNQNVIREVNDSLSEINDEIEAETIYWLPKDEIIESLMFERDFYYSKLHEFELMMKKINIQPIIKSAICDIIFFESDNFHRPSM